MKIGISTSVMQRGRSGVGQYVLALVRALLPAARRHEITLFVLREDLPHFEFARGAVRLVPVEERFRSAVRDIAWHQTALPVIARRLGLDVLHVPSYRRMLWPKPCALVATIHDLAPFRVAGKYDRVRMFYGRVVARRLAWRQDEIVAVSRHTACDVAAFFGVPRQRLTVVPNGLDHERFHPRAEGDRCEIARRRGVTAPFFLYVARLEHPAKNHVKLVRAFNRFKAASGSPWQLVLGGSDWHGAEHIHAEVRRSPWCDAIHTLGFVADADLPAWYRAAGGFVYPSAYEGFGLPPVEAMACGCPVLSSSRGALAEVVGDAALIVEPDDEEDFAAQLRRFATDEELRLDLRDAGLKHACAFDWARTAEATLGVYQLAARRTARVARAALPSRVP
ncbi:MAG: glycosyltransferase family 4 protein [Opitutae bacterium]|nr:glycosyltransferase family 4 protein [Opitutae bacterium]